MILNKLRIVLISVVVVCGCAATPNLMYGSHCHSDFSFKKSDRILLALPEHPKPSEEKYLPLVRTALSEAGFLLVDSVADATRLLTFYVSENVPMTWHTYSVDDRGNPALAPRQTTLETRVDSGYTDIVLAMYDVKSAQEGRQVIIWQATVTGRDLDFASHAVELIVRPLNLYGKNELREEKFRPLPKRN